MNSKRMLEKFTTVSKIKKEIRLDVDITAHTQTHKHNKIIESMIKIY